MRKPRPSGAGIKQAVRAGVPKPCLECGDIFNCRVLNRVRCDSCKHQHKLRRKRATYKPFRLWSEEKKQGFRDYRNALWRAKDPHARKEICSRKRRSKRYPGTPERLPYDVWEQMKALYDFTCLCCGKREPEIKLTLDHIVPISRGGQTVVDNIQPLCMRCNISKFTKTIDFRNRVCNTAVKADSACTALG